MTKSIKYVLLFAFLPAILCGACNGKLDIVRSARNVELAELREIKDCEACLAKGGTWQPEADACTANCELQDVSCFKDQCPAPCAPKSCGNCFSASECEAAGCNWNQVAEAQWCSGVAQGG